MANTQRKRQAAETAAPGGATATSLLERKLQRLGLTDPQSCIVHLPIRYEDETRIVPVASLRPGQPAQVEVEVLRSEVLFRPRRQLSALVSDGSGDLVLRWLNFYSSQEKQLAAGKRLRVRGEVRNGFQGLEMVHPRVRAAGGRCLPH